MEEFGPAVTDKRLFVSFDESKLVEQFGVFLLSQL